MAKPAGITPSLWAQYLYVGKTPDGRQKLTASLNTSPGDVSKSLANMNLSPLVEDRKLDKAVDQIIAQKDPRFRQIISSPNFPKGPMNGSDFDYVRAQRAAWWASQVSKMNVILSDQSLYSACQLSQIGVNQK